MKRAVQLLHFLMIFLNGDRPRQPALFQENEEGVNLAKKMQNGWRKEAGFADGKGDIRGALLEPNLVSRPYLRA